QVAGDYAQSNAYFFQVLDLPEGSYPLNRRGFTIGRIGKNFAESGEFGDAAEYLLRYDSIAQSLNETRPNIEPKLLLGELHEYMLEEDQAAAYYLQAYEMASDSDFRFARIQALYYLLDFHLVRNRHEGYGAYLEEYLNLVKQVNAEGRLDFQHAGLMSLDLPPAQRIAMLRPLYEQFRNTDHVLSRYFTTENLVRAYRENEQVEEAIKLIRDELHFARQKGNMPVVMSYYSRLAWLYAEDGRYEQAYRNILAEKALRDSLHSVEVAQYIDSLNVLFETAEKDAELAAQQLTISRERRTRTILIVGIAAILWFGLFVVLFLLNRNRLNQRLARRDA
ncbi:MAG: hypothetical protein R3330_20135, partial [Saprospiraceae bacterium]|nr:hypothetical protein [Saprospiraceae bacterium]